ncbi:MAG: hypothetical protein Kow0040_18030 [Thermogutta sp.]
MTSTEWGVILGLFSTWLMLLLPWLMTVHARLAVVISTLQDLRRKVEVLDARRAVRSVGEDAPPAVRSACPAVTCPLAEATFSTVEDAA